MVGTRGRAAVTMGLVAVILVSDLNPVRSWLVTVRGYQSTRLQQALSVSPFPDFKTPAAFIRDNASARDLVFVLDSREIYNYLGRADYWIYSEYYEVQTYQTDDVIRDKYVSTPLIRDLATLQARLAAPAQRKWLVASETMPGYAEAISPEIRAFISSAADRVVYTGKDGATKVYLFDD